VSQCNPYSLRIYKEWNLFHDTGTVAATAACMAIDKKTDIHDLEYQDLKSQLLKDKQILDPIGPY
jgi:hypothetical protein